MNVTKKMVSILALTCSPALGFAGDYTEDFPSTLSWSSYSTASSSYAHLVSIGSVLKEKFGTSVRVLPGDNDVSRMAPLRSGRVDLCGCGIAGYFAAEGVLQFSSPDWGPQPIRIVTTSLGDAGQGLVVAGDVNVKTPADLKGKRVAWIKGGGAQNLGAEAFLAFGGLTWDDVERVEFPGYSASFPGLIQGQVDAAFTTTVAPQGHQIAASPRGLVWPELSPDDKAGWDRLTAVAPYMSPHSVTQASGGTIDENNPLDYARTPYPLFIADKDFNPNTIYNLIKVITENYDDYKDNAPGAEGYALENQNFFWVVPFHDAVIDYYKEIGHWTEDMQAHQDMLVKRQNVLLDAWATFSKNNPSADEEAFRKGWMEARAAALTAEGMDPVFE